MSPAATPVTEATLRQSYLCLSDHYFAADPRTDGVLLVGAYAGLLSGLDQLGLHRAEVPPALVGDRDVDWNAFRAVFRKAVHGTNARAGAGQRLGAAALDGMAASVADHQTPRTYSQVLAGHAPVGIRITGPVGPVLAHAGGGSLVTAPANRATAGQPERGLIQRGRNESGGVTVSEPVGGPPPIGATVLGGVGGGEPGWAADGRGEKLAFHVSSAKDGKAASLSVAAVQGGPAAVAGLRVGDVIQSIDGKAPIVNGEPDRQVAERLLPPTSGKRSVSLVVHRPSTGRTWTVSLTLEAPGPDGAGGGKGGPRVQHHVYPGSPGGPGGSAATLPALPPLPGPAARPGPAAG